MESIAQLPPTQKESKSAPFPVDVESVACTSRISEERNPNTLIFALMFSSHVSLDFRVHRSCVSECAS